MNHHTLQWVGAALALGLLVILRKPLEAMASQLRFWFVYWLLFGSQLRFLKWAETRSDGISLQEAESFYDSLADTTLHEISEGEWRRYYEFMLRQGLLLEMNQSFVLTQTGRRFLAWMGQAQLTEQKAY